MLSEGEYLGYPQDVEDLRSLNDRLNVKVIEQVNDTQELVMMNNFTLEANEYLFKKSLQERMSDIASWHWVLEDLTKRLDEAIDTLRYEHKALRVVVKRIQEEIDGHLQDSGRPGALIPLSDSVEDVIMEEFNFLRDQKKKFENMIPELDKQTLALEKTKKKIKVDVFNKRQALSVEQACINIDLNLIRKHEIGTKKKKRGSPLACWEKRCVSLKTAGLKALNNAVITRQQVRGARVYLSIVAQAYAAKVDSALRRRTHANKIKLQDLNWQKDEAMRDYKSLEDELTLSEQNILDTMEKERVAEARLADRTLRPGGEHTKDDVDRRLRDELRRLKSFSKQLRANHERITSLQNHLTDSMVRIDCCTEDIIHVISLDEDRIRSRLGEEPKVTELTPATNYSVNQHSPINTPKKETPPQRSVVLTAIKEEEDDYPFED